MDIKQRYALAVTAQEKTALAEMLETCPAVGARRGR
ncbi:hypothetical protein J2S55_008177 [Streptosporangium brasiliense]|uniref:Transposase n=1 Tax=Streptosporangium brasiliense TaxID=47480 RepID=A0ABT9RJC9_9ACTN|nr:hypothetical protein [Streptosporangium brasiliense]